MAIGDWHDEPPQGFGPKWFGGAATPLLLAGYAISVLLTAQATLPSRGWRFHIQGLEAVAYGIALMGAAVFFHCHYFWGNTRDWDQYSPLGKGAGAMVFIGGIGVLVYRVLIAG